MPKAGEDAEYCEDAIAAASDSVSHELRVAVADGASSGSFSGVWARLLAMAFVNQAFSNAGDMASRLGPLAVAWSSDVFGRQLPWHALERAKRGAFSTIAGLAIGVDGHWRATAIGDSCVFLIRENEVLKSFPLTRAEEFSNNPVLIASDPTKNDGLVATFRETDGHAKSGDMFLLATDAFSQFVIEYSNKGSDLRSMIAALEGGRHAQTLVNANRRMDRLHNDDIAVVIVRVS